MKKERYLEPYLIVKQALPSEIREALIKTGKYRGRYYPAKSAELDRSVEISYLKEDSPKLVRRIISDLCRLNNPWKLSISKLSNDVRIQRYRKGDYTEAHTDYEPETGEFSKLTVVIPLVEPICWHGGVLQIGNSRKAPSLRAGDAVIFPSFTPHRVTNVLSGERITLSAWMIGPSLT